MLFDIQQVLLIIIMSLFSYFSIKQDLVERKVSNKITFSLFIFAFIFFLFHSFDLVWIDFIFIFSSFLVSFLLYFKGIWGAADGKIFIAIMLILVSFIESAGFLRWVMNLLFFYGITLSILSITGTSKKVKKQVFKKMEHLDSAIIILIVFIFIDVLSIFYVVDSSHVWSFFMFFIVLFVFLYKMKIYLKKHFRKMFKDVKLIFLANLLMWNFLYGGMLWFVLTFAVVFSIKTFISLISELSSQIKFDNFGQYDSPFSLYLFLTTIFTIMTNQSFVEIVVRFFY